MGVTVTRTGDPPPTLVWTAQHMGLLARGMHAQVASRTFDRGVGADGKAFDAYSDRPMTVSFKSEMAFRLEPKGGLPAYGRGRPRKFLTASGRPGKGRAWEITGRHYPDGYGQYKRASRKGLTNSGGRGGVLVDLILSGQLARAFKVIRVTRHAATIGITGTAREYGVHVDARRPFVGLSPQDMVESERIFADIVAQAMGGTRGPAT